MRIPATLASRERQVEGSIRRILPWQGRAETGAAMAGFPASSPDEFPTSPTTHGLADPWGGLTPLAGDVQGASARRLALDLRLFETGRPLRPGTTSLPKLTTLLLKVQHDQLGRSCRGKLNRMPQFPGPD